jgi:GATA-binding protein
MSTFPIPRDPNSQSPPLTSGGIRLPKNPLTDIASLQHLPPHAHSPPSSAGIHSPRKAATVPGPYYNNAYPTPPGTANGPTSHHMFELRRGSLPAEFMGAAQRRVDMPDPSTGWQNVQMNDLSPETARQTAVA